jgi:outer membrane protein TolC
VLFVERSRTQLEADKLLLEKKKEQPAISINRWAGRDLNEKIVLIAPDPTLISKTEVLSFTREDHPSLIILNNKITASQSKSASTKYLAKPKIGVGIDYALVTKRSDVDIPGNGRDIIMPMGSISIPIHTDRYEAIRQEELVNQASIEAQKKELQDMFEAEIEMAYNVMEYQNQVMDKYGSLKEITSETLKLMRSEYAAEGTRFEELLRLEMELIDYDQMIISAEYEKALAMVTLMKYVF